MQQHVDFKQWLIREGCADRTVTEYQRVAREADPKATSTPADLTAWYEAKITGKSRKTAIVYAAAIQRWARYRGLPPLVLARSRAPKTQQAFRDGLSFEELQAYKTEVRAASIPVPAKTILLLLPETGLRIAEACALHWGRQVVDHKGRRAFDIVGKRGRIRRVVLNAASTEVLNLYCRWGKAGKAGFVFPSDVVGKPHYSPPAVRRALRQVRTAATAAGRWRGRLVTVTPHVLRHTFASHLLDLGVSIKVVQDLLGHENVATTMGYLHPSTETMQAAVDQLVR